MKKTAPGTTTRRYALLALATLGLALAAPVHARHDFADGPFVVAKRDRDEDVRDRRDDRRSEGRDTRDRREAESDEPQGYGYGYERRQQERYEEDERRRGRRQ